jgi:transcriptional regulator with XRE-family HTH domain
MTDVITRPPVGTLLRDWRQRRRLSQLDLALDAGVSSRHLSFVETGRSKPGREMLLRVAEQLQIPFRDRNHLLLAAGHAPEFPERPLGDPALAPVREALDRILAAHAPYPAVVFDRAWNLVAANPPMSALPAGVGVDEALLEPPVNLLRIGFHPRGLAPLIVNLAWWRAHFLERLARQIAITGDDDLQPLLDEVAAYPVAEGESGVAADAGAGEILGPVRLRAPTGGEWSFFGMFAGFDTPFEVTTSELAIELLFPADEATAEAFRKGAP